MQKFKFPKHLHTIHGVFSSCLAEFVCNGEVTIPLSQKCDGNNDCPTPPWGMMNGKASDENLWLCTPEGEFMIYISLFLLIHVTAECGI